MEKITVNFISVLSEYSVVPLDMKAMVNAARDMKVDWVYVTDGEKTRIIDLVDGAIEKARERGDAVSEAGFVRARKMI